MIFPQTQIPPPFLFLRVRYLENRMRLSKEAIEEFKEIYREEFGEDISDDDAQELGENLLFLFDLVYRPIPGPYKEKRPDTDDEAPGSV
jgi:hypothetical protein